MGDQGELMDYLRDGYRNLPDKTRAEFDRRFGNAWVQAKLRPDISLRRRKKISDGILDQMMKLDPDFAGTFTISEGNTEVASVVVKRREGLAGPHFRVLAVAAYNPIPLERLQAKFDDKTYRSRAPIELLAYYDKQDAPLEEQLRQLYDFIESRIQGSGFRRVWVFNVRDSRICYP
jgi:hypothetical protein